MASFLSGVRFLGQGKDNSAVSPLQFLGPHSHLPEKGSSRLGWEQRPKQARGPCDHAPPTPDPVLAGRGAGVVTPEAAGKPRTERF